jgi:hypothetical protein
MPDAQFRLAGRGLKITCLERQERQRIENMFMTSRATLRYVAIFEILLSVELCYGSAG